MRRLAERFGPYRFCERARALTTVVRNGNEGEMKLRNVATGVEAILTLPLRES